ncbi:MAG TPA: hypothetical protein VK327_11645 [Candidatus Paceibacterota bacterium]|nr:hypothetical protein [Candidatus Paceibacterota bacterium]
MKTERIVVSLAAATLIAFASGCEKQTNSTAPEKSAEPAASTNAISGVTAEIKQSAAQAETAVKETTQKVVAEVKQTAETATAAAASKVDAVKSEFTSLVDKTKSFINDKRYEDALASLKQLSNLKLTPEQQKTVDDLKAQLQKLMSSQVVTNAASALNNLLKK